MSFLKISSILVVLFYLLGSYKKVVHHDCLDKKSWPCGPTKSAATMPGCQRCSSRRRSPAVAIGRQQIRYTYNQQVINNRWDMRRVRRLGKTLPSIFTRNHVFTPSGRSWKSKPCASDPLLIHIFQARSAQCNQSSCDGWRNLIPQRHPRRPGPPRCLLARHRPNILRGACANLTFCVLEWWAEPT